MTGNKCKRVGGMLLAAGGSSRLGRPKQLVVFEGETLIRRCAKSLIFSVCSPVVVVLGAETEQSSGELDDLNILICVNEKWRSGISSSIKAGLRHVLDIESEIDAVIITLCDQYLVTANDIDKLAEEFVSTGSMIVASTYGNAVGVPALFERRIFGELFELDGDEGARKLIRRHSFEASTVKVEKAEVDINTPDDVPQ